MLLLSAVFGFVAILTCGSAQAELFKLSKQEKPSSDLKKQTREERQLDTELRPYMEHQIRADEYCKTHPNPALFMQMRLGKTLVAIRHTQSIMHPRRVMSGLVVAPLTVLEAWERELKREGEKYLAAYGLNSRERGVTLEMGCNHGLPERLWVLTNYEAVRASMESVTYPWDVVIVDESTKIRNPKAQIAQLMCEGFRQVPHRMILSGLPNPESAMDFFMQFKFLDGTFMGYTNFYGWRARYFEPGRFQGAWDAKPGSLEEIRNAVQRRAFMLKRHEVNIGSPKIHETRWITLPPAAMKAYKYAEKNFATEDLSATTNWQIVLETWLGRMAGGFNPDSTLLHTAKVEELMNLLTGELKREQVVVWFRFNKEIDLVAEKLRDKGLPFGIIRGQTPVQDRNAIIQKFRDGKLNYALVQIKCGKFGTDFSTASTAIYYSNSYSLEERLQSADRILHPTRKEPLLYIDLVAKGTVDEEVVAALTEKNVDANSFSINMRQFIARLRSVV